MKYIEEFRNPKAAEALVQEIRTLAEDVGDLTFMEVCGTHTMSVYRHGIKGLFPRNVRLISGPGCPVCVTPQRYMDRAIAYARRPATILTTFGDMMRVPGTTSTLEKEKANGADVRIVYSPMESLRVARENPDASVIFLAVGFETTAPLIAATVLAAAREEIVNFFTLVAHKTIPEPMRTLAESGELALNGFLCPAHVSTVIGAAPYRFLAEEYGLPCVIAGFEPLDILHGVAMLLRQCRDGRAEVEIQYRRVARPEGNPKAMETLREVFEQTDTEWRGLGTIPNSGLRLREPYRRFDAVERVPVEPEPTRENKGCRCGEILRGVISPEECPVFAKACDPENPLGPCMVSSEGTCAAYYRYGGSRPATEAGGDLDAT